MNYENRNAEDLAHEYLEWREFEAKTEPNSDEQAGAIRGMSRVLRAAKKAGVLNEVISKIDKQLARI